ncbi:hypothetical protein B0E43_08050 [Algoriphagus sp. A40]|nr:hypothetical protein B0E43_08050 [Algoriphagus sp. A40]
MFLGLQFRILIPERRLKLVEEIPVRDRRFFEIQVKIHLLSLMSIVVPRVKFSFPDLISSFYLVFTLSSNPLYFSFSIKNS